MNRETFERKVFQRVMEKLEGRGMFHVPPNPPGQKGVRGLSSYLNLDADDLAYVDGHGRLVLESVGDDATEASRRLSMLIGQVKRGSEKLGLDLKPDLRPATVRVPEVNGFVAFATFDTGATKLRLREAKSNYADTDALLADYGAEWSQVQQHPSGKIGIKNRQTGQWDWFGGTGESGWKKSGETKSKTGEAQVPGRPFRHSEARGVEQRLPTLNQIGDSPVRQRAAEVVWVQAGQPYGVPDAMYTAYHEGYELWVTKHLSSWVALGRPKGSKGQGTTIVQGGLNFAKDSAIKWAERGGTDLSY